jgi:pyruvate/2-oxoglutarate dehydrogenase complex dihydrolipoamide acyltransferase (E2) component
MRLVLAQLIDQLKMPHAPGTTHPYPRLRNFVLDVLAEGARKHIVHLMIEADIGGIKQRLAERRQRGQALVSMTGYIAKSFACAIEVDKRMQAYRLGKSRLMVFDDVDLAFLIERQWEGAPIPVFTIVRAAQQKSAPEIHRELQAARTTPLATDGPMNALETQFFLLSRFLRKAVWFVIRRNPYWFKDVAGTVAVTSLGMYASGAAAGIPITPMTLTLTIGTIEKKPALHDGQLVERDVVHLVLSVDHDIVDGAPLMRFTERFKQLLRDGTALQ